MFKIIKDGYFVTSNIQHLACCRSADVDDILTINFIESVHRVVEPTQDLIFEVMERDFLEELTKKVTLFVRKEQL